MIVARKALALVFILVTSSIQAQPVCSLKMPTIEQIRKILRSNLSESDRYAAALCLTSAVNGQHDLTDSDIKEISAFLEDKNPAIVVIAADALASLGKRATTALPALKKALESSKNLSPETLGPSLGPEHSIRAAISSIESEK